MSLLDRLDRFNRRHPWSHNDLYGPWAAHKAGAIGARRVLDVGCGTGHLVDRLRRGAPEVTGLEPDPDTARRARERFAHTPGVTILQRGFDEGIGSGWDAITLVAVLHHLPLEPTLRALREALAPKGRLVIVGCHREEGPVDLLLALVSALLNPLVGMVVQPRAVTEPPPHMRAPTAAPRESLAEIRAAVRRELPGARIRRGLFWRYTLVYDRPA
ncbi:methyltransferase [Nocardiopsis alba]|uniref:Methyltransferase n=1 Tax=Nocardiopsis alba TaxID=53437 RepID=A0A7K2IZX6_9ACTN|nr:MULTISPECIES: class I SAM-dependent methyltransferase [Nocardiopsis]MEC3891312.1 class I SAM-dependent methyltransferase [Nocardiopsis sp. LDBS1602]MYR35335.1 methyltransferase [Nocardiopsis alba]